MSTEAVNHPAHYGGDTTYEAIKVITAWKLSFCLGNTVKYICRAGKKEPDALTDLRKALWYLNYEINRLENGPIEKFLVRCIDCMNHYECSDPNDNGKNCPICRNSSNCKMRPMPNCCECGEEYSYKDLVNHGHILCPACRKKEVPEGRGHLE